MSRLDSRPLDELVQATVELQNRTREERRMRPVAFTAQVDERELDGLDSQTLTEIIESRWQHLNYQMATYIAQNLSANQYQLLRAVRHTERSSWIHGVFTLTLTLEVGQVTERPSIAVVVSPEDGINTNPPSPNFRNRTGSYATIPREQMEAAIRAASNRAFNGGLPRQPNLAERGIERVRGGRSRIAEELDIDFGPTETPPAPKPDPVPHKRHILIDRKKPDLINKP